MQEVFSHGHLTALLLLRDLHKVLGCLPEDLIQILLLLIEASLDLLIELLEQLLLSGLNLRTDCPVV